MNWTLLEDNFNTLLVLFGTLSGALIGLLANYLTKREERKMKQFVLTKEYQHKYFTEPINSYISETLDHMENFYWTVLDVKLNMNMDKLKNKEEFERAVEAETGDYKKRLFLLRGKEAQIRARVGVFGDTELTEAYEAFQKKVGLFRTQGNEEQWNHLKDAIPFATTIFKKLGPRAEI